MQQVSEYLKNRDNNWIIPAVVASTTAAATWLWMKSQKPTEQPEAILKCPFDLNQPLSKVLPGDERIHYAIWGDDPANTFTVSQYPATAYENFQRGMAVSDNGPCVGWRESLESRSYSWIHYNDVFSTALNLGSGLIELGCQAASDNMIGIYAQNSKEWVISGLACMSQSMAIVPLYESLGAESSAFIVNQTEITTVICDNVARLKNLLSTAGQTPKLENIIVVENTVGKDLGTVPSNIKIWSYDKVIQMGRTKKSAPVPPKPSDLFIICYTSGTTGTPKGVMVTHENIMANIICGVQLFELSGQKLCPSDSTISYLPLAHMFEQMMHGVSFFNGARVGFFSGNVKYLTHDIKTLKPTIFPVVPRLLNRLYDKVNGDLSKSTVKRAIFNTAYQSKLKQMEAGNFSNDTMWDRFLFSKIRAEIGGNVRIMVTGSAPIAPDVLSLCRVMLGCYIYEGYGQTECTAAATLTIPGDMSTGHVGAPIPCAQIKLVDVPELNYFSKDDKGEICMKGSSIMKGYFKEPGKTAEAVDEDGWLHSGDIGMWLLSGTLKVIDRKKHIFKLAQGEYVAPEKIESVFMRMAIVAQIFVDGSSLERFLVGIVVPDEELLRQRAAELGVEHSSFSDLCADKNVRKAILSDLQKFGKENKLSSIELVHAIFLCTEPFSVENGLLTPTFKSKRPQLRIHFKDVIDQLYKE